MLCKHVLLEEVLAAMEFFCKVQIAFYQAKNHQEYKREQQKLRRI